MGMYIHFFPLQSNIESKTKKNSIWLYIKINYFATSFIRNPQTEELFSEQTLLSQVSSDTVSSNKASSSTPPVIVELQIINIKSVLCLTLKIMQTTKINAKFHQNKQLWGSHADWIINYHI